MTASLHDPVDDALARAVVYRMLSVGFQPPTAAGLERIGARDGFPAVTAAARRLEGVDGEGLVAATVHLTAMAVPDAEALSTTFRRLFGHTTRGLVCACETEYGPDNGFHQPQQLADISGYYLAFGLRPVAAGEVRADHIACECEFMDFLSRKEAVLLTAAARGSGDEETLAVTRQAARTFLRDHLGRFGRTFAAGVTTEDEFGYFGAMGHVLLAFLGAECTRWGVQAGPVDLVVRPDEIDEAPMACGSADELIQIQRRP